MQHQLPVAELGRHGEAMARAVSSCVHCGFCLPACPTYRVLGEEMDSPRGRILLMKHALEGTLSAADAAPYLDRCLGCLACETACPSGVRYRDLIVPYRALHGSHTIPRVGRAIRHAFLTVLERPRLFRTLARCAPMARLVARVLPAPLRSALDLVPRQLPRPEPLPAIVPAAAPYRARVALLTGCAQQVLRPSINVAACRVLAANGVEVLIPPDQGCCGALARHLGLEARADQLAAALRLPKNVDAWITTAAGCGSALKDAGVGGGRLRDVAEFLDDLGLISPLAFDRPTRAVYQDACHLAHGQGIREAPRRLLRRIENLTLIEATESDMCCGSAGLYNLEQPATAATLGQRKALALAATGADVIATGNIGCLTQITTHLAPEASHIPVRHTIEILDSAYSGPRSGRVMTRPPGS